MAILIVPQPDARPPGAMGRKKKDTDDTDAMGVVPTCPNSHTLVRKVADGEFECDICSCDIEGGSINFGCTPCDYSLCNGCYIKLATGGLATEPQAMEVPRIDPDVAEMCEHFGIEDRIMLKLNEAMRGRHDSFGADLEKLWEELGSARSPAGLLMAKIKQMEEGNFVGRIEPPKDVKRLIDKYRLDNDARTKLTGFICSRGTTMKDDLAEIERRLETSGNPSATVMTMIVKLHRGEKLPEPFKAAPHRDFAQLGAGGGKGGRDGSRGRGERDVKDRDRDRERRRSRSRERERGRR